MKTKQPAKMGRPTVYKVAMTPAERQRRYRDKIKEDAHKLLAQLKESL